MLSGQDAALVHQWQESGIPVEVVCRAIADAARDYTDRHGEGARIPGTLSYFQRRVEEAAEAHAAEPAVGAPTTPAAAKDGSLLAELAWIGQHESDPRRRNAYRAAWRVLKSGNADSRAVLAEANRAAVGAFVEQLTDAEASALERAVAERLAPELGSLGQRGRVLRERAVQADLVRAQYGLVRLTPDD